MICGKSLEYIEHGREMNCAKCGKKEITNVYCPDGHYVCEECHGLSALDLVKDFVLATPSIDPIEVAESLINHDEVIPMLGCEHALIAAGSLMAALKNEGTINITSTDMVEVLQRTRRQAIGAYCGLTGVCGIVPAIGACFSVILGAACPKDRETAITMRVVARITDGIANETGPCCCKNFLRTSLRIAVALSKEYLQVELPISTSQKCRDSQRHPHGCRKEKCLYF